MASVDRRDQLLRALAWQVDARVLAAVACVARESFVPAQLRDLAWEDRPLPIGCDQTISQPSLVATMCDLLDLAGDERVLDVGTGSGYHAALLGTLCAHVYSIERHRSLATQAHHNLAAAGITNVTVLVGDGARGHPQRAPYDAINVAAASSSGVPGALERQLAPNGRLVLPTGRARQQLVLVRRHDHKFKRTKLAPVRFVPLVAHDEDNEIPSAALELAE